MVFQVKYSKFICAAKHMHELLLDPGNEGVGEIVAARATDMAHL